MLIASPEFQPHLAQSDRNHVAVESRRDAVLGEKRDLRRASAFVERFDGAAPTRALAVVDLAEIENLTLNHAPVVNPAGLDHRPGPMLLAVLAANLVAQKHAPESRPVIRRASALVGTTADSQALSLIKSTPCRPRKPRKSQKLPRVGEVGLGAAIRRERDADGRKAALAEANGLLENRTAPIRLTWTRTTYRGDRAIDATAEMGGRRTFDARPLSRREKGVRARSQRVVGVRSGGLDPAPRHVYI